MDRPSGRVTAKPEVDRSKPDSQGTSSVLYGDELKPELCGLFPESVLCSYQRIANTVCMHESRTLFTNY